MNKDSAVVIRNYRLEDRQELRRICYVTGYMGAPADWYWRDFPSFADIWTAYYTDREPESTFVAELDGRVIGYLLGCVDTARAPALERAMLYQILVRFLPLRPGTAGFFWRALADILHGTQLPSGELDDARWPSHLHIDLLPEGRGLGAGAGLMRAWFERLAQVGSPGCHLSTLAENTRAIAFFEKSGFRRLGPATPIPGMRSPEGTRLHQQVMVRDTPASGESERPL